jgi:serine/threonine protein phosphatase PrpC
MQKEELPVNLAAPPNLTLMNGPATLSLAFAAATDTGCKRANNQDSFGYNTDPHLYVVCDGVGGALGGEVASNTAVRNFIESFEAQTEAAQQQELPIESRLLYSIEQANRAVRDLSASDPRFSNMGTTLVCACVDGARAVIGNVGDSRAYLIRDGICAQITHDHSLIAEQLQNGLLTPEMAEHSSLQSVITRAIGMADTVEPDLFAATLQTEDTLLLASDGLTRYLQPAEIAAIASPDLELPVICKQFVECAKQRGGADNITCIVLRATSGVDGPPSLTL